MMPGGMSIEIRPHVKEHQAGVIDLILGIQRSEYGLAITAADQPDLADIAGFYQIGAGNFWVALAAGRVVGTIGLREFAPGQGALRKMFVAPDYRGGAGVAGRLLATLLTWARAHSVRSITLGTTDRFLAAHRFYEKHGFGLIPAEDLPAGFPRMAVDTRFYSLKVMPDGVVIQRYDGAAVAARQPTLCGLLQRCVDDGASIGFLPPLAAAAAEAYWRRVSGAVHAGETVLWVAESDGRVVGSVQLTLETRANGGHRAEVAKLMVDPAARRRGIGRALMSALEDEAGRLGRTTLVLDTREGDPSERLYAGLGYQRVGVIPEYARGADGGLHGTVFFYKLLKP